MGNKVRKKKNILLLEPANNISDSAWIKNIQTRNNKWVTMKRTISHITQHIIEITNSTAVSILCLQRELFNISSFLKINEHID